MAVRGITGELPCGAGSSDRQWQCAGAELEPGGAAGHTAAGEPAGGTDPAVEAHDSTRWGQEDGRAAGTEDVGGQPCQDAALGGEEEEEGEQSPSGVDVKCQQARLRRRGKVR